MRPRRRMASVAHPACSVHGHPCMAAPRRLAVALPLICGTPFGMPCTPFTLSNGIKPQRGHGTHTADGSVIRLCFADAALPAALFHS